VFKREGAVSGQQIDLDAQLPIDERIRIGKLENGFTYYIRENKKPENRVELHLAVNAGSILETEKQLGLAHLLEHMAFNGTTHFEKNELIQYLQSIGVKFGPDLNAYTSFDETIFMLTIPSDSSALVDKGFLVMEDWAFNQTLDSVEIDKERGVVIEEWRLGQGPWNRMLDKYLPVVFTNSRYADRLPIGKKEIIESFEYETIRSFYRDWYRPDLMALIVVGDIDVDEAEAKIKEHFSRAKMPEMPKERVEYEVPDHEGTMVSIATDKEAPVTLIRLMYKADVMPQETEADYLEMVKETFLIGMLNRRLVELNEKADPPFVSVGGYYGSMWARNKNALQEYAVLGENGIERGIKTLLEENNRVAQFGFTNSELERYKLDYLKSMQQAYNERDKTESASLAAEYIRNYLEGEPIPGIEFEYDFVRDNIDKISLEDINQLATTLISSSNRVIVVNGPENDHLKVLTEESVLALAKETDAMQLQPYEDQFASVKLMEAQPSAGSIVSEKRIESIGATELKLSNGAKVLLKPTDFKNDEIRLSGFAWGGSSIYEDVDYFSAINADGIVNESGVSDFSQSDLKKVLAGKTVYVGTTIGDYMQHVNANCSSNDLETMLQLLYLKFTEPRIDTVSFQSYITKNKNLYKNLGEDPENYFYDKYNKIKAQNHPRGSYLPLEEDWDKINYNRAIAIYKDLFGNANEFTFVLVGAFNSDDVKPLIAEYIGALPVQDYYKNYRDLGIRPPKGKIEEKIVKGHEPKSLAILSFTKDMEYNEKDAFLLQQLALLLNRKYYEILREKMSGVYGVRTSCDLIKIPYQRASLSITIPCSPDNVDSLIGAAIAEIMQIQKNGVEQEDIEKSQEIYKREKQKNLEKNGYWLGALEDSYQFGFDFDRISSFEAMQYITSENIQRVANEYIAIDEYLQVVLYPEDPKE
jgi:zinc protease